MNEFRTLGIEAECQNEEMPLSSLGTQQLSTLRPRSASLAPSGRSSHSNITTVEDHWELVEDKAALNRQGTIRLNLDMSFWDKIKMCAKWLIGGNHAFARTLQTRIQPPLEDAGSEMFDQKDCPFIMTVSVFARDNQAPERCEQARCIFDTGCAQGNLISLDLARRLGYTKFEQLKRREKNGGTPVRGDVLKPVGAILVSWYHSTSPQVFSNMRFLVIEDGNIDLIVGVHSIVKHKLLAPPCFSVIQGVVCVPDGDKQLQALMGDRSKCRTHFEDRRRELRRGRVSGSPNISHLERKVEEAHTVYDIADERCTLYEIQKNLGASPMNLQLQNAEKNSRAKIAELEAKIKRGNGRRE